jgi:hypothetical protein
MADLTIYLFKKKDPQLACVRFELRTFYSMENCRSDWAMTTGVENV